MARGGNHLRSNFNSLQQRLAQAHLLVMKHHRPQCLDWFVLAVAVVAMLKRVAPPLENLEEDDSEEEKERPCGDGCVS